MLYLTGKLAELYKKVKRKIELLTKKFSPKSVDKYVEKNSINLKGPALAGPCIKCTKFNQSIFD